MNWTQLAPALVDLFRALCSPDMVHLLPEHTVTWLNRQAPFISPSLQAGIYLKVFANEGYSMPERAWVPSEDGARQVLTQRGKFTLQVLCKSLESTDVSWHIYYLENVQINIYSEPSLAFLKSLGLGLIEVGAIKDLSAPIDQREASIGALDLKFSFAYQKPIPVDFGVIEHVSGLAKAGHGATIEQVTFQADKPEES